MPIVGFVGSDTPDLYAARLRAFRLGLRVAGFTEGQNIAIEYRWAEGRNDRLPISSVDCFRGLRCRRGWMMVHSTWASDCGRWALAGKQSLGPTIASQR
jgi:hypothetical protein